MRKSRLTEAQIIGLIKEQGSSVERNGLPTQICRNHGLGTCLPFAESV